MWVRAIPDATRLVGTSFLDDGGTWHPPADVRRRCAQAGASGEAIAYCGGGVDVNGGMWMG